jgi:hypothetical protein
MTLTIELPDNLEAALKAHANAQGLSEASYVRTLLERDLVAPANGRYAARISPEERANAFEAFVADFEAPSPTPDEAFQRENWYPDR